MTKRLTYTPPWNATRPWLPRICRGGDEWYNSSLYMITPLGMITWYYKRNFTRDVWAYSATSPPYHWYHSPEGWEGEIAMIPMELITETATECCGPYEDGFELPVHTLDTATVAKLATRIERYDEETDDWIVIIDTRADDATEPKIS